MPNNRETLQVNQPNVITPPENNWPDPLTDPANRLKVVVTNSKSGTQTNKDIISTSQQDAGEHQLAEGKDKSSPGNMADQGGNGNKLHTSQQNAANHSTPESERSQ